MFSEIFYLDPNSITLPEVARQRGVDQDKVQEMAASIAEISLIHPIVVTKANTLVVGAHRMAAFKHNATAGVPCPWPEYKDWTLLPVRVTVSSDPNVLSVIELEENVKRNSMQWQDVSSAVYRYHTMRRAQDPEWTQTATAKGLSLSPEHVSHHLCVASAIAGGKSKAQGAATFRAAYQIAQRELDRALEAQFEVLGDLNPLNLAQPKVAEPPATRAEPSPDPVLNVDFLSWLETYTGPKFNFIHCDFPYGINHHKSDQGYASSWGGYKDTPETFWILVNKMFQNLDKFMHTSGHIVFWYAMKYHEDLIAQILKWAPELTIDPYPLIWSKSDGKGIIPDHQRGPRRTYETALHITRGDRKILKPVTNSYSAPTGAKRHQSEKPESMLRHFFSMYLDTYSSVFDPTAGGGSALRAAASLGAGTILGLEVNPEYAKEANTAFKSAEVLRASQPK